MSDEVRATSAGSSNYDLTRIISKYLDLHMMFPLLDFVEVAEMYPADQVAQARLDLLDATNMVRCPPSRLHDSRNPVLLKSSYAPIVSEG